MTTPDLLSHHNRPIGMVCGLVDSGTLSAVCSGVGGCLQVGKLFHYVTSHPGQLNLAIPPWAGAMRTGDGYGHR